MTHNLDLAVRLRASAFHLGISLGVAVLSALLVFSLWYPYPYREISGGRELFFIVVAVDLIVGPLITLAIFDCAKRPQVLMRDLAVIGLIQIVALGYGLWTVCIARPVHLVFEMDRFRVIHAVEVDRALLQQAPLALQTLSYTGPTLIGVRPFRNEEERVEATISALNGVSIGSRPDLWQHYSESRSDVLRAARLTEGLLRRFPDQAQSAIRVLKAVGRSPQNTVYLPLVGRKSIWTIFLDPMTAEVVATMPLDSF